MLLLTSTSDLLQVVTGSTGTVDVHVSWVDNAAGVITPGRTNTPTITTATTTTILASPAASTQRNAQTILIRNRHATTANNITVKHTDGVNALELFDVNLAADSELQYLDGVGWTVFDATGAAQQLAVPAFAVPAVVLGTAAAAGAAATAIRTDATLLAFDATTPATIAAAGAVGVATVAARRDHTHTIGAGIVTRTMQEATGKGWQFLGTATAAATTIGPVIWTGTFLQFRVDYWIAGYNGGTPVGRLLFGAAAISTTALTNGGSHHEGITAPSNVVSIPGIPLAVTLSAIARSGTVFVRGASGALKTYEVTGANGNASVSVARTLFRAVGSFSDLGTNLPLQRMQLTVYDTLVAVAASAQAFLTGSYLTVWGRNND